MRTASDLPGVLNTVRTARNCPLSLRFSACPAFSGRLGSTPEASITRENAAATSQSASGGQS